MRYMRLIRILMILVAGGMGPLGAAADDNAIFGMTATVEPNVLIIFDNSGSMSSRAIENKSRMEVARETIKSIIDKYGNDNRFGIMIFHENRDYRYGSTTNGGFFAEYNGRYPVCSVKEDFTTDSQGNLKTGEDYQAALADYKDYLKGFVDTLSPESYTPLAETLAEAGLYFAESGSWFNADDTCYPMGGVYPDDDVNAYSPQTEHPPIGYRCRKNYIILMTDGQPTHDNHYLLTGEYINGKKIAGGEMPRLDQIAGFLYDNDVNSYFDTSDFTQNIVTYAIGFQGGDPQLLQDTADRGMGMGDNNGVNDGGLYFDATDPEELSQAFISIMSNINQRQTLFAAPVVPVSKSSKAYAGSSVYMSLFQPTTESRWIGNLKKYTLNDANEISSCDTRIPILDDTGRVKDSARSCWSEESDGNQVDAGGAGARLLEMTDAERNIYANISDSPDLTAPANAFTTSNNSLAAGDFGVEDKDELINEVRCRDKEWKLGDLNHSRPAVTTCVTGNTIHSYIFAGANDGLLHCFDDDDGSEKWAFVPQEQFSRLKLVNSGTHNYFMDGSPAVADTESGQKIVICGERRGGNHYYALDITDISGPNYLYTHTTGGQSWKTPQFIQIAEKNRDAPREVFLLTGGYDVDMDGDQPADCGRSVYTIDAQSGKARGFSLAASDFADMSCVVNAVALDMVDDGKSIANQVYAADLGGHVYAARDYNDDFSSGSVDGEWEKRNLFKATAGGQKIFSEVDIVVKSLYYFDTKDEDWQKVSGEYVYFGTGDRANPLRTDRVNHFYCIKNDWRTGPLTENSRVGEFPTLDDDPYGDPDENDASPVVVDVTDNLVQDGTEVQQLAAAAALNANYNRGWYLALKHPGEKCLSTPIVFGGVVYFTTYTPPVQSEEGEEDPCRQASGDTGTSRLYALDYETGAAVYAQFYDDGRLDKNDRCKEIVDQPVSIAPSPKIFITDKGEKLFVGPHAETPLSDIGGVRMFYWITKG